jgi:hypothetical protein
MDGRLKKYKRGILTMATGKREFVEMAVDMALSYKHFNEETVSCIVDNQTKKIIQEKYSSIFEQLIILPENYKAGRTRKFSCAELSPYESTVFMDSDILLLNSISHLWNEAELNKHVTMIGHYVDKNSSIIHHGFCVSELCELENVNKYLKVNSGFFHFMEESSKRFFKECEIKYKELQTKPGLINKGWLGDEIAIGILGHIFNVQCFNPPSPMMWDDQLSQLIKDDNEVPLCHFIAPIPPSTVKWLVKRARYLRKVNGIETGGEKIWIRLNNRRIMAHAPTLNFRIKNKIREYISKYVRQ